MKLALLALPLVGLAAFASPRDASACGGCFVQQGENTQVTGHRMVLSVSKTESTLWDQIKYSGNPKDFAWVLPTRGQVEIGLSSDALFTDLEQASAISIQSPLITCPQPPNCGNDSFGGVTGAGGSAAGGAGQGVNVLAQEVVGPYETVQLESKDPTALTGWLENHGYQIPADVVPVLTAYVGEGFNFLALKLVPGKGIDSMRPVRVSSPGASPVLPLRMVAAGTGAVTPITLWVLGEGRYEPSNFPAFQVQPTDLVWDWDSQSSNYAKLKADQFAASDGKAWLVEGGEPLSKWVVQDPLQSAVQYQPADSGYGDGDPVKAQSELDADLAKLTGSIDDASLWFSRMHAELSRPALADDLVVAAAKDQATVVRTFQADKTIGTPPACPVFPPCNDGNLGGGGSASGGGVAGGGDVWPGFFTGNGSSQPTKAASSSGCAIGGDGPGTRGFVLTGLALAAVFAASRRRRR